MARMKQAKKRKLKAVYTLDQAKNLAAKHGLTSGITVTGYSMKPIQINGPKEFDIIFNNKGIRPVSDQIIIIRKRYDEMKKGHKIDSASATIFANNSSNAQDMLMKKMAKDMQKEIDAVILKDLWKRCGLSKL